jgi:hypothetical protein
MLNNNHSLTPFLLQEKQKYRKERDNDFMFVYMVYFM